MLGVSIVTAAVVLAEPFVIGLDWPALDCPARADVVEGLTALGVTVTAGDSDVRAEARQLEGGDLELVVIAAGKGGTRRLPTQGSCAEMATRVSAAIERLARPLGRPLIPPPAPPASEPFPPAPASPAPPEASPAAAPPDEGATSPERRWAAGLSVVGLVGEDGRVRPGMDLALVVPSGGSLDGLVRVGGRWPRRAHVEGGTVRADELRGAVGVRSPGALSWTAALVGQLVVASSRGLGASDSDLRLNPGATLGGCATPVIGRFPLEVCANAWAYLRAQQLTVSGSTILTMPRFGAELTLGTLVSL